MRIKIVIGLLLGIMALETLSSEVTPSETINNEVKAAADYFDVYDPYESFNKKMYKFNYHLDNILISPVVTTYKVVVPKFTQRSVTNFFKNSESFTTSVNALAQGEGKKFMRALARFSMNSILGLGGTVDVATKLQMPDEYEDFGLTLSAYGLDQGPFLVLPFLGPSNLRDAVGVGVDFQVRAFAHPFTESGLANMNDPRVVGLYGIDLRKNIPFGYYQMGSPFEYEYIRYFYSEYRRLLEASTN